VPPQEVTELIGHCSKIVPRNMKITPGSQSPAAVGLHGIVR
jgi:hypothetical protein